MGSIYAKDVCKIADDWLGYHEGDNNWNIFAKVLDDCGYFAPQKKQNVPWCAVFCNFCVLQAAIPDDRDNDEKKWDAYYFQFQPSYNNYSAGAPQYASYFKNAGEWYDEPQVGDMCFFDFGNGIAHVGIVVDTEDYITTIEGNAGDEVQKKWYSYDDIGGVIAGFGRPRYDGIEDPSKVDHKPKGDDKDDNDGDDEPSAPLPYTKYTVSVGDYLNIRTEPEYKEDDSNVIGKLYDGAIVYIFEIEDGWGKIGENLWVSMEYLE